MYASIAFFTVEKDTSLVDGFQSLCSMASILIPSNAISNTPISVPRPWLRSAAHLFDKIHINGTEAHFGRPLSRPRGFGQGQRHIFSRKKISELQMRRSGCGAAAMAQQAWRGWGAAGVAQQMWRSRCGAAGVATGVAQQVWRSSVT